MTIGLVGRKCGMTRVFTEAGESVPVTVVQVLANRVAQVKNPGTDGYRAVQLTYGKRRQVLLGKAVAGHYAKLGVEPGRSLVEFRLDAVEHADIAPGTEFTAELFKAGQLVDVTGTTIGKGYAGVMKRHNFRGGPASHGHSVTHRAPGSIGQRQTPDLLGAALSEVRGFQPPRHAAADCRCSGTPRRRARSNRAHPLSQSATHARL